MDRLKKRADFVRVATGRKEVTPGLIVQALARAEDAVPGPEAPCRVGFTVTRKVGNAVERNRVRRRLVALSRALLPRYARNGTDYVLVGRRAALTRDYERLLDDLERALIKLGPPHRPGDR